MKVSGTGLVTFWNKCVISILSSFFYHHRYAALITSLMAKDCRYLLDTFLYNPELYQGTHTSLVLQTKYIYIYNFFLQFKMSNWVVAYMCVCIGLPGPPFMVPDEQVASLFGEWCWGESRLSGFTMTNATERLEDVRGRRLSLSFLCRFLQGASVTWQRRTRTTPWRRDSEPGTWTTWRKMCTSSPSRALRNQRLGSSGRQILGHCWSPFFRIKHLFDTVLQWWFELEISGGAILYDVMSPSEKWGYLIITVGLYRQSDILWAAFWVPAGSRNPISNTFHMLQRSARHKDVAYNNNNNIAFCF